ncbi:MAG: hypothetical protein MUD16_18555, partial [Desulfobacterales bacterium]|nr:hypothetical protein [Desulfobacterales bacterium]
MAVVVIQMSMPKRATSLADALAVEGPGQVVDDVVGDGAVVLVAHVDGSYELVVVLEHRVEQVLDPVGGDAAQIRVHHGADLDLEAVG